MSFLRVKVYSAGFYMDKKALEESARTTKGWLPGVSPPRSRERSGNSTLMTPLDFSRQTITRQITERHQRCRLCPCRRSFDGEHSQRASELRDQNRRALPVSNSSRQLILPCIPVPTRNTDLAHLRDGFVRAISARQKLALKTMALGPEQSDAVSESITTFKNFFPNSSVAKGQELLLVRTFDGNLAVEYGGKTMGVLRDPWVAKEMMLAYFADGNVPSHAVSRRHNFDSFQYTPDCSIFLAQRKRRRRPR